MEYPRARFSLVVSLATEAEMVDLMIEPPTTMIIIMGTIIQRNEESGSPVKRVTSPYSTNPALCKNVGSIAKPK